MQHYAAACLLHAISMQCTVFQCIMALLLSFVSVLRLRTLDKYMYTCVVGVGFACFGCGVSLGVSMHALYLAGCGGYRRISHDRNTYVSIGLYVVLVNA